jgi:putative hemolysin
MNLFQPILIATACILALSACAAAPPAQGTRAPATVVPATVTKAPPPASSGMIQPVAAEVSAYGAANTGGTYPYGTAQGGTTQGTTQVAGQGFAIKVPQQAPQQANAETTEGVVVMGPDGTVWLRDGGDDAAYRGDVESCYAYAQGQVAHDARIESDVASAFDSDADGFGLAALRGRMNNFERTNRVPALFSSCMSAKGYNRQ